MITTFYIVGARSPFILILREKNKKLEFQKNAKKSAKKIK